MATLVASVERTQAEAPRRPNVIRKILVALAGVLIIQGLLALCLISANQLLLVRQMPFGVVGPSLVLQGVQSKVPIAPVAYPSKSAAISAIDQGKIYGAYVSGRSGDTFLAAPAKSFFAQIELQPAFVAAAHKLHRPITIQNVKPLPRSDPVGAVVGFLLLPLLIGGYLAAVLVFKAAAGTAAARWRASILIGYAIVGAVLTDLIAGLGIGAYASSHFWPLLPCFMLITGAVVLAAAAIQGLFGGLGTILVLIAFIILGGAGAGGGGLYMLPVYWRNIGVLFPPQNAVTLIRQVLYFGGHDITTPLVVLFLYVAFGLTVIGYLGWIRPTTAGRRRAGETVAPTQAPDKLPAVRHGRAILIALGICAAMQCLFAFTYMDAGHQPVATNLPFGVTGSSPILAKAEHRISLQVSRYPNESAVKTAINENKIWGALLPASTAGKPSTLIVVPSASDLAPLDLAATFGPAAKSVGLPLKVQAYAPVKLAKKDPYGIVESLMLLPLLIGGYVSATALKAATGTAAARWRDATLLGFAIVAGLVVDLIAGIWLHGYPTSSFWIVWPICSLIIAAVAFTCVLLQKLIGSAGTLLTIIAIILFGNPSSGGANGVPYLPAFWRDIGPYLPPRNAYLLLHRTIYFHGHGISLALTVLLIYLVVAALPGFLLWFRGPQGPITPDTEAEAAAMTVPIGAAP